MVKAGAKEGLFRNSIASASLVSDIIIKKYQQAQPLYRQEQALRLQGLRLSRQSMANWIVQAANQYLKPLYELLHEEGFPSLRIGSRLVVPKEQFRLWVEHQTGGAHEE